MSLKQIISPEIYQVDRKLHHEICLAEYEKSFDFRQLTERYKKTQLRRLNDVLNLVEIGDENFTSIKRPIDTFDLINPNLSKKIVNACYSDLQTLFSKSRVVCCLKAVHQYCSYLKENPYIYIEGQKTLYIPEYYGFIESPVNRYTLPRNKPSDASKLYLTETEYKNFLLLLWNKWNYAQKVKDLKPANQLFFICVVAGELGLRLQEVLGLELQHINLIDDICLVIKGKGSKGSGFRKREVPLTPLLKASLKDFLKCFPRNRDEPLFQNFNNERLTHSTAYKWLDSIVKEIQTRHLPIVIEKGFGFHAFRRTYARLFAEKDGDFFQLMKNTGWKYASTASHYTGASKLPINFLGD